MLIVAYNAVTTLCTVLNRIPAEVWDQVEEVVVFDDASNDDTYALAVGHKALHQIDKLTVIRNEKNLGYGGNQKLGYEYFIDKGFDIVVLLHGDGQYAPGDPRRYVRAARVRRGPRGIRLADDGDYGGPRKGGMPLYKLVGNKILTAFENRRWAPPHRVPQRVPRLQPACAAADRLHAT